MARSKTLTRGEDITHAILVLRGQRVILDRDLAEIYGVTTKRLNEQVKRNAERFPEDFMFQLTPAEAELSRSQFATLKPGRGQNIKYRPYAFTEHAREWQPAFARDYLSWLSANREGIGE